MLFDIRKILETLAALAISFFSLSLSVNAQSAYPTGPITMIVGWPAGGPSDNVARLIAAKISTAIGQPVVIDNRAGAGGNIGSDVASRARPDGYTIMLATVASHGLNSALYPKLNYDPIKDFAPVGLITSSPSTLLVPVDSPIKSIQQLISAAKAEPGKLNYGSGGVGSSQHLAGASFKKIADLDIVHVPYKGTAPAMTDLMAGRVDMVLTTGVVSFVRSGKVRALAVASRERLPALPEVPTFEEAELTGFYTDSWYGLVAPAGTPRPILEKLNASLAIALNDPEVKKQFSEMGFLPAQPLAVDAFWDMVQKQMPEAAALVNATGARVE